MSALMATVKWDIKDIMSQHSQYVDSLLKVRNYAVLYIGHHHSLPFILHRSLLILLIKLVKFKSLLSKLVSYHNIVLCVN